MVLSAKRHLLGLQMFVASHEEIGDKLFLLPTWYDLKHPTNL
jgi:hypothetical protein